MPGRDAIPAEANGADPVTLEALGRRLREMRRARDMTQVQVAELLNCDHTSVSRIESGKYPLTPQMFRAVERLLSSAAVDGFETWFMSYLDVERRATVLRTWQPLGVPGLLQTEAYAREILRGAYPGRSDAEVEQRVAARMTRQKIWEREDPPPPMLSAILGSWPGRNPFTASFSQSCARPRCSATAAAALRTTSVGMKTASRSRVALVASYATARAAPPTRNSSALAPRAVSSADRSSRRPRMSSRPRPTLMRAGVPRW
jgi:transcriptional regulator with XRE-family HTH domain